jgi:hypothetical protein
LQVVSLAEMILLGGNHLAHLGMLRQDAAGQRLRPLTGRFVLPSILSYTHALASAHGLR